MKYRIKKAFSEGSNRYLFVGLLLIAVAAVINFYLPKGPKVLYVIAYIIAACLFLVYMIGSLREKSRKTDKNRK